MVCRASIYGESSFDAESRSLRTPSKSSNNSFLDETFTSGEDSDAAAKLIQSLDTKPSERKSLNKTPKSEQSVINISSDLNTTVTPDSQEGEQRFSGVTRRLSSRTSSAQTPISIDLNDPKNKRITPKKTPSVQTLVNNVSPMKESESKKSSNILTVRKSLSNDVFDVKGVKKLLKTPKVRNSPSNDLSNPKGVKALLKTPKVQKSPKNDLSNVKGVKKLLGTPKIQNSPLNDLTDPKGVKQLLKTPKYQKSPKNDLSSVKGLKKLMQTPKVQKSPLNDLRSPKGLKKLLKTPKVDKSPLNDLTSPKGMKKLLKTPKVLKSPNNDLTDVEGVKKMFATRNIQTSPMNDITNLSGVDNLMMTPEVVKSTSNFLDQRRSSTIHKQQLSSTPFDMKLSSAEATNSSGIFKHQKTPRSAKKSLSDEISYVSSIERFDSTDEDLFNITDFREVEEVLKTSDQIGDKPTQSRFGDQGSYGEVSSTENEDQVTFTIEEIYDKKSMPPNDRSKIFKSHLTSSDVSDTSMDQERVKTPIQLSNTSVSSSKTSQIRNSSQNRSTSSRRSSYVQTVIMKQNQENEAMQVFEDKNILTSKQNFSKLTPRLRQKSLPNNDVSNINNVAQLCQAEEQESVNTPTKKRVSSLKNSPRSPLSDFCDVNESLETPKEEILRKVVAPIPTERQEDALDEDFNSATIEAQQSYNNVYDELSNETKEKNMLTSQPKLLKTQNSLQNDYSLISDVSEELDSEEETNTTSTERRSSLRNSPMQNSQKSRSFVFYKSLTELPTPEKIEPIIVTRQSIDQPSTIVEDLEQSEETNEGRKGSPRISNSSRKSSSDFGGVEELVQTPKKTVRKVATPEATVRQNTVLFEHPSVEETAEKTIQGGKTLIDTPKQRQSEGVKIAKELVIEDGKTSQSMLSNTHEAQQNSPNYVFNISDISQKIFDSDEEETVNFVTSPRESRLETLLIQNSPRNLVSDSVGAKKSGEKLIEEQVKTMTNTSNVSQVLDFTEDDTVNASANKSLGRPSRICNSPKNRFSNFVGVKELLKTPKDNAKIISSPKNNGRRSKLLDEHSSNMTVDDTKEITKTSTPSLRSSRIRNSPRNSVSDFVGVQELLQTSRGQSKKIATPKQIGRHSKILEDHRTDTTVDNETEEVEKTPTITKRKQSYKKDSINNKSIHLNSNEIEEEIDRNRSNHKENDDAKITPTKNNSSGISQLSEEAFKTPIQPLNKKTRTLNSSRIRNSPRNRLSDLDGVKELLQTPKRVEQTPRRNRKQSMKDEECSPNIPKKSIETQSTPRNRQESVKISFKNKRNSNLNASLNQSTPDFEDEETLQNSSLSLLEVSTSKNYSRTSKSQEFEGNMSGKASEELIETPVSIRKQQQNDVTRTLSSRGNDKKEKRNIEENLKTVMFKGRSPKTPKIQNESQNDLSDASGIAQLYSTPIQHLNTTRSVKQKRAQSTPLNLDFEVAKKMLETSKEAVNNLSTRSDKGSKIIRQKSMTTPADEKEMRKISIDLQQQSGSSIVQKFKKQNKKQQKEPRNELLDLSGVAQLFDNAVQEAFHSTTQSTKKKTGQKLPENRLSDFIGVKELLATPLYVEQTSIIDKKTSISAKPKKSENVKAVEPKQLLSKQKRVKVSKAQKTPRNDLSDVDGVAKLFAFEEKEVFAASLQLSTINKTKTVKTVRFEQSTSHNLSDVSSTKELVEDSPDVKSPMKKRGRPQKVIKKLGRPLKRTIENDKDDTSLSKRFKTSEKITEDSELSKLTENDFSGNEAELEKESAISTRRQRKVVIPEFTEEDKLENEPKEPVKAKRGRKRNQNAANVNAELSEETNFLIQDQEDDVIVIDVQRTITVEDKRPRRRLRLRNKEVDESDAENTTRKRGNKHLNDETLKVVETPKQTKRGAKKQAETINVTDEQKDQKLEVIDKASKPANKRGRKPNVEKNFEVKAIDGHEVAVTTPKPMRKRGKKQDSNNEEEREEKLETPKPTKTRGKKQNVDLHKTEEEEEIDEKEKVVVKDSKPTRKRGGNRLENLDNTEDQKEVEDAKIATSRRGRKPQNIEDKNTPNEKAVKRRRAEKKIDTQGSDVEVSIEATKKPTRSTRQRTKIEQASDNVPLFIEETNHSAHTVEHEESVDDKTLETDKKLQPRRRGKKHIENLTKKDSETEVEEVKKPTKRNRAVKTEEETRSEDEKPTKRTIGGRGQKNRQESEVVPEAVKSSLRKRDKKNEEEDDELVDGAKIDVETNKKSRAKREQRRVVEEEVETKVHNTRRRR